MFNCCFRSGKKDSTDEDYKSVAGDMLKQTKLFALLKPHDIVTVKDTSSVDASLRVSPMPDTNLQCMAKQLFVISQTHVPTIPGLGQV
jgi:hypothetical protein